MFKNCECCGLEIEVSNNRKYCDGCKTDAERERYRRYKEEKRKKPLSYISKEEYFFDVSHGNF